MGNDTIDEEARRFCDERGVGSLHALICDAMEVGQIIGMRREREAVALDMNRLWAITPTGDVTRSLEKLHDHIKRGDHHPGGDPLEE